VAKNEPPEGDEDIAWQLEHSVEAEVSAAFAWSYWTDVGNWDDPPARFEIEGPFAAGARGRTHVPGNQPREWTIAALRAGESYTLETDLEGATLSFEWRFEPVSERRVKLTQRIGLSGENAQALADGVQAAFGPTLADGMKRIAGLLEQAAARAR
jgi:hypothetical protein